METQFIVKANTTVSGVSGGLNQGSVSARQFTLSLLTALTVPPLLLQQAWRARSEGARHLALTLFVAVFGFTMTFQAAGDAISHQLRVELIYSQMSFYTFVDDFWRVLFFQHTVSGAKDIYIHVVSYFSGAVLGLPQLFFPIVALIYGFFFAGSVAHVLRYVELSKLNYVLVGLLAIFLFQRGLDGFFTVRTWTGMWILVYACLKYHEGQRLRYLLLMFVPPFIHIGFFLLTIPAWIVLVFGARPLVYTAIFAVSSVTTVLPVQDITVHLSQTERGASQVHAYLVEERPESLVDDFSGMREGGRNWYDAYRRSGLQRWAPTVLVLTLLANGFYLKRMTLYQKKIFSIGLLTLAFSNMTWFLYAVHNRSLEIAVVLLLAAFLMTRFDPRSREYFRRVTPYYQWGITLTLLLFFPVLLWKVSVILDRFGIFSVAAPMLALVFPEANMSLKEVINFLLGRG